MPEEEHEDFSDQLQSPTRRDKIAFRKARYLKGRLF